MTIFPFIILFLVMYFGLSACRNLPTDQTGPLISDIKTPGDVLIISDCSGTSVEISAKVTDPSGVESVLLWNRIGAEQQFISARMEQQDETYNVTLKGSDFLGGYGSDLILGMQLTHHTEISHLAAYSGWNTAENTLGTVLVQAAIYSVAKKQGLTPAREKAQLEFLFMRLLDDFCYQALERSLCMLEDLPALGFLPTEERLSNAEVAKTVSEKVTGRLQDQDHILEKTFCADNTVKSVSISNVHLPWQRLFEIGFDLEVEVS